jgi:hypothetical protein
MATKDGKCCIKECESKALAKDMCAMHYMRLRKFGSPMRVRQIQFHGSLENRLLGRRKIDSITGCWNWTGCVNPKGYGVMTVPSVTASPMYDQMIKDGARRPQIVSRIAWAHWRGSIEKGLMVCHSCDNPLCFNPDHLFLGTQTDNMRDMNEKGRNRQPKGEHHRSSKLTDEQVREIRASTETDAELARRYSLHATTIAKARRGGTWKHLTTN